MPRRFCRKTTLATLLASVGLSVGCASSTSSSAVSNAKLNASSIEIDSLLRATAYDGPVRPRSEVAIVFTMDGRPNYESAYICKADDRVLQRDGKCATVVYLPPGQHVLAVKYVSRIEHGEVAVPVHVQAGKLYQLNASSLRTRDTGAWRFMPMPDGAKLTFRNIAPFLAAGDPRIDAEVPYGAN